MIHLRQDLWKYLKVLELEQGAGPEEIKRAYRLLAKKYHPDINPAPDAHEHFIEVTEAYEILIGHTRQASIGEEDVPMDAETLRATYERIRQEARENARRYAHMKYEKFRQEQEAFKKSGWHDVILTLKYFIRALVVPLIALCVAMPLISEAVADHPSGYVMFWLIASILLIFVIYNRKAYFCLDPYYYNIHELRKLLLKGWETTTEDCYYCKGYKAISRKHRIVLFRIRNMQMRNYGFLYGASGGVNRSQKTVSIPRSRKAFFIHAICSFLKLLVILACLIMIKNDFWSRFSLPAGIFAGSLLSGFTCFVSSTKPKTGYFLSAGMLVKILLWLTCIYFLGEYAALMLFFDPIIEATLRFASRDQWFTPLLRQHPEIDRLLRLRYQFYMELPVWSVVNPFFKWLF